MGVNSVGDNADNGAQAGESEKSLRNTARQERKGTAAGSATNGRLKNVQDKVVVVIAPTVAFGAKVANKKH